jgi:flavin reductase (DIM6/NTAB) family NADH-FMN oxidoreductase RutF
MADEGRFRRVMGHLAMGVTIVTGRAPEGHPVGLTATSVCSVSLDPLLVQVCVDRGSSTHDPLIASGSFAINLLTSDQEALARCFASAPPVRRFRGVSLRSSALGNPLLDGCLAWVDCRIWKVYPAGDHSIVVGEVLSCDAGAGRPLVYFRGRYRRLGT